MKKYYIEVENYQDDSMVIGIRVINQATKNRRERLARTLRNTHIDFFRICPGSHGRLGLCQELSMAATKLMSVVNKEILGQKK